MKIISVNVCVKTIKNIVQFLFFILLFQSCGTKKLQFGSSFKANESFTKSDSVNIDHSFYLIGDAGYSNDTITRSTLSTLKERLDKADKNSTLIILGDNIYPYGMPADKNDPDYNLAVIKLRNQLKISKDFKGKTIVIPGNHDYYSGHKGLENQTEFVNKYLKDEKAYMPKKNCAIDDVKINDNIILITIDSQWFLEDWDDHPNINENCEIKTREGLFVELEDILSKNQDKVKIIAIHHPILSNGSHGGQYSWTKQIYPLKYKFPLPIIGSFINLIRKTSGVSPQDIQNKQYTILNKRIKALIKGQDNVVVVSGHDHNLQFIDNEDIKQVISGSGSKQETARVIHHNDFSYGNNGYAKLDVLKNGQQNITYYAYTDGEEKLLWQHRITTIPEESKVEYPKTFPATIEASIYTKKMTTKTLFHNMLWGKHYKYYYSLPIEARTANLETLYGGLKPFRAGGGHQSNSLRLKDKDDKEFVMRGLKKSASRFLQAVAFKDQYVQDEFKGTYAESFLLQFYTSSHPYTPFAVGNLAESVGVSHTNPELYYVPKQKALKDYNTDYGNELYMIEERPSDSQKDLASFKKPDAIANTEDVLKNLKKDEKYSVDEDEYIKARLFDMLIGDWDRHSGQWSWGEYNKGEKVIYKPIPKDRDQAFTKYDGPLLAWIMTLSEFKHMQSFKYKIRDVKWLNREPYPLDVAVLKKSTKENWLAQAKYIQENLTDKEIEKAFKNLPKEVKDKTIDEIIAKLKYRKNDLTKYASDYYEDLQKTIVIVGTNKKDKFVVNVIDKNNIEVKNYRVKKDGEELVQTRVMNSKTTKELWIYGLDDDDIYQVNSKNRSKINIRLIGGLNHDDYKVEDGRKVIVYDYKSKENTYSVDKKTSMKISDDYDRNFYDYERPKYSKFSKIPTIGYNPDDGLKLGIKYSYTSNSFKQNPFTSKNSIFANYFFASSGYELKYLGLFPKLIGKWDLVMESRFTSPNFVINHFGYGNESVNNDRDTGMDYNRVKFEIFKFSPILKKTGRYGSEVFFEPTFENIKVENTAGRYVSDVNINNKEIFKTKKFTGAKIQYGFENYDLPSNPTMGMGFSISAAWLMNVEETNRNFPTFEAKLNFSHKIDPDGKLVLGTLFKGKYITNNNFEFYQGATLGGDYDLRGYRNERFLGNKSYFQSTDLRWNIGKIRGNVIPMTYGILTGYDYGRVWLDGEDSNKWHQSYGGGIWINGLNMFTGRVTCFKGNDGDPIRIAFGLGFGF